jgi:hypothetical protein
MKTLVVLAVSSVLAGILFCAVAMAAPPIPNDVQIVKPDPSLPKEIADFWGKWEGGDSMMKLFLIVEKIAQEKANLYIWRGGNTQFGVPERWERIETKLSNESGKYKLLTPNRQGGNNTYFLEGEYLVGTTPGGNARFNRVP